MRPNLSSFADLNSKVKPEYETFIQRPCNNKDRNFATASIDQKQLTIIENIFMPDRILGSSIRLHSKDPKKMLESFSLCYFPSFIAPLSW